MATSNVVELPTAAKRKVSQPATRSCRRYLEAIEGLPQFPMQKVFEASPYMARCQHEARLMLDSGDAAIMQLTLAVMAVMDEGQKARIWGRLIALTDLGRPGAEAAMAWVNYENSTKARKMHIDAAAHRIAQDEGFAS